MKKGKSKYMPGKRDRKKEGEEKDGKREGGERGKNRGKKIGRKPRKYKGLGGENEGY